ncbi:sugar O-acetyltransferase [Lapidilactobacillus bayanensis]|uniref:sugar O-acetyltransferase n=1 Tax=Lapidilactobacillus bayanensis TaxID=2485998 RepID=UPI0013DDE6D3
MISGNWYPDSKTLRAKRNDTRLALQEAQQLLNNDDRIAKIKNLFGHTGQHFFVETGFECSFGENINVGDDFYANRNVLICDEGLVTIGSHCKFGPGTTLLTPIHPLDPAKRQTGVEATGSITIGDNAWLGGNVTILPNVTLDKNVVVGAGSVVTKSFPDNVVIVGNPAHILRTIPAEN